MIEQELARSDIPFERQYLSSEVITDGWNILAKAPGRKDKKPLLFIFHLDTTPPGSHVEPYLENGRIMSRGNSVLGADGKLPIAVVLEAVSQLKAAGESGRPLELLFTVCQELGMQGTRYADYSKIESEEALVPDHYVTGEVLLQTPARYYIHVELTGNSSHVIHDLDLSGNALAAAVQIIHQIPVGRVSENLNINIFDLVSLSSSNIVPGHARFDMEIRCFGKDVWEKISDKVQKTADLTAEQLNCRCPLRMEKDVPEADFSANADMIRRLQAVYERSGIPMKLARSFGFMDSTYTNQIGIRTLPIGLTIHHSHSVREYVVEEDMKTMLELIKNIIRDF